MALEPITREETYLAAAAGQNVETPEPITRKEMFLDAIAKSGGGTGGGSAEWELIGEATSDGTGTNVGIYVPIDFTQYSEVFVKVVTIAGENCRVILSSFLEWYNGAIIGNNYYGHVPATVPTLIQITIKNIGGVLYPFAAHSSGNSNIEAYMEAMLTKNSAIADFAETKPKYIRVDANDAVVSAGVTLTVYGRR